MNCGRDRVSELDSTLVQNISMLIMLMVSKVHAGKVSPLWRVTEYGKNRQTAFHSVKLGANKYVRMCFKAGYSLTLHYVTAFQRPLYFFKRLLAFAGNYLIVNHWSYIDIKETFIGRCRKNT